MYPTDGRPLDGSFVQEQVESLRRLGTEVDVFHVDGIRSRFNYVKAFPQLTRYLAKHPYDVIHSHHTYCMVPIAFARAVLRLRTPTAFTLHESEYMKPKDVVDEHADFIKRLVYSGRLKRAGLNMADMAIPVWEGLTRGLDYRGREVVLPCGTDTGLFQPRERDECRRDASLPVDKHVVFFPPYLGKGSKRKFKRVDLFLEAMEIVKTEVPDVVVVTGGEIPRRQMPDYMNAADVVVQTSLFEASPMVIKEAMAVNAPIVSLDVGDTAQIIGDTEGCYVCADNPEDVARHIVKALNFGRRTDGRRRLLDLKLDIDQVARRLNAVYEDLLQSGVSAT